MASHQISTTVVPISSGKDPEKDEKASNLPGGKHSPSKPASHRTGGSEETRFDHASDDESRTDKIFREAAQRYSKKAAQAKEAAVHGIHQAAHHVKEIVVLKAVKAKDDSVSTGKTAAEYVGHKAVESKDLAVEAAGYVGHKEVEAKDAAMGTGQKSTLSYVGEKAVGIKDTVGEETKEKVSQQNIGRDCKSSKMEFEKDEQHEDEPMEEEQRDMKSGVLGAVLDTFVGIAHEAQELLRWP